MHSVFVANVAYGVIRLFFSVRREACWFDGVYVILNACCVHSCLCVWKYILGACIFVFVCVCVCVCVCVRIGGFSGTHTHFISGKWGIQKQWGYPQIQKSLVKQSRGSMHAIGCPLALLESSIFTPVTGRN